MTIDWQWTDSIWQYLTSCVTGDVYWLCTWFFENSETGCCFQLLDQKLVSGSCCCLGFSVLIYRRTQKIYWFCLSISCRFVVLATLFLEIRRIISLWRKLMQLNKCNLFGRSSTKWLLLSFSFCVNADWMFDILNAYSSRTAHRLQKGCKLARLKLFSLNSWWY